MEEKKQSEKKLSYEDLKNALVQMGQQAKFYKQKAEELNDKLQETQLFNAFKRTDYLFKVLEFSRCFDDEFVITCADEIKTMLTPVAGEGKEE